ncbi:ComF family protein [Microbacter margulisiae]|uniref:ComF family protein n=1 Tax=Microbacter margulisiae TaxID=1350067 RepID=A0A7W5DRN5_9PORP|nr:double zinc ribbon domain-containing protein [Microbacter margulisiae]MBB3187500.1 ComF family protein [Microbacter margulisiae]
MKRLLTSLLDLIYPNLCLACHNTLVGNEQFICFSCLSRLSFTTYHLEPNNPIEKRFWGKFPIHRATSLFFFQKETTSQLLIHQLKYKGEKEMGEMMGKILGERLKTSPDFDVDVVVPVPLHPRKLHKRGYNQSEWIAKGVANTLEKPMDTKHLLRIIENPTQTRKGVYERWENAAGIFDTIDTDFFTGKHILLVDDVITTGATIEACAMALQKSDSIKISVVALACA